MTTTTMSYARSTGQPRRFAFDPWLIGTVAALLLVGLIMVASASIGVSERETGNAFFYFQRQLIFVGLGLVAALLAIAIPTSVWEKHSIYLLGGAFVLLVLVLVPGLGHEVNGSRRWVRLGIMNFQVSELARVMLLTYIASYAVRRSDELCSSFKGFMKPVAVLGAAAVLLLAEPDFGAATVLMATGLAVLFLAGVRLHHLLVPVLVAVAGMALLAVTSSYRMRRLTAFRNPWDDPFDSGFQLVQSLIAIGRGEWFGVGLGSSVQKLFYLPGGAHGLRVRGAGRGVRLRRRRASSSALFALLVGRALDISRKAADAGLTFQSYLAASIGIWLGLQAFVNIGVNMGLLPTKGLTLPLLSYGGSSMLVTLGVLGAPAAHPSRDADVGPFRREPRGAPRMTRPTAMIMAGGTGGHVFPALATARVLRARGFDIVWLGTRRGIEARLVPAEGIPVEWLSVSGLRGKGVAHAARRAVPPRCWRSCRRCVRCAGIVPASCSAPADSSRARAASRRGCCAGRSSCTSRTRSRD